MIVAAFIFGWVPSACERESRLLAIAEVGLRRLRRLHVRARGGPPPLAYSLAPLESQPAVLAWAVAQGRGAADGVPRRRCRRWLGTQRRPGERGGHGDALAPSEENFSIGTAFQKEGGTGMLKQLHTNAVTVLQHTRTPAPWWNSINVRFSVGAAAWSKSGEICLGGGVGCTG